MKLKDIADMTEYLENRCYCEGEIYDRTGFFFDIFTPETDCIHIAKSDSFDFVVAKGIHNKNLQIIAIINDGKTVKDCVRLDATDNNIKQIKLFTDGKIEKMILDEYKQGETARELAEIMDTVDAIML